MKRQGQTDWYNPVDIKMQSLKRAAKTHMHRRIQRENATVKQMIELYCRQKHSAGGLCPQCTFLLEYASRRLEQCRFQEGKTTCARCPVHCYKPEMREQIRIVMRYSGPRMLCRHPIAAIRHVFDRLRKEPLNPQAGNGTKVQG
jgi:hypothetical protein